MQRGSPVLVSLGANAISALVVDKTAVSSTNANHPRRDPKVWNFAKV